VVALLLAAAVACPHPHRDPNVIARFVKSHPCPTSCATYVKRGSRYVLHRKCGACQVDHICPLTACGLDAESNLQWLTDEENRAKSDDPSLCTPARLQPDAAAQKSWEAPP
jgi:hypothetical protein